MSRQSSPRPVVLYVHTLEEGGQFDPEWEFAHDLDLLERRFPGAEIRLVRGLTNEAVAAELKRRLHPDPARETVRALIVNSHGGTIRTHDRRRSSPEISNDSGFSVDLFTPRQVESAFGPVLGRLEPGSTLAFVGCELADLELEHQGWYLRKAAAAFGMTEGSVYVNRQRGAHLSMDWFSRDAASTGERPWVNLARRVALAPLAGVTDLLESLRFNNGYEFEFRGDHGEVRPTSYFDAIGPRDNRSPKALIRRAGNALRRGAVYADPPEAQPRLSARLRPAPDAAASPSAEPPSARARGGR